MSDRIFGCAGLVLAAFYIWAASIIPDSFMVDVVGPRAFPYIVGAVLAASSIYFVLRPDPEPAWPAFRNLAEVFFTVAVLFLYAALLPKLGFVIATILATAYLTWRLGSRPLMSLVTGICTAFGIYVVFHLVLGLSLAKGPLGF